MPSLSSFLALFPPSPVAACRPTAPRRSVGSPSPQGVDAHEEDHGRDGGRHADRNGIHTLIGGTKTEGGERDERERRDERGYRENEADKPNRTRRPNVLVVPGHSY